MGIKLRLVLETSWQINAALFKNVVVVGTVKAETTKGPAKLAMIRESAAWLNCIVDIDGWVASGM